MSETDHEPLRENPALLRYVLGAPDAREPDLSDLAEEVAGTDFP